MPFSGLSLEDDTGVTCTKHKDPQVQLGFEAVSSSQPGSLWTVSEFCRITVPPVFHRVLQQVIEGIGTSASPGYLRTVFLTYCHTSSIDWWMLPCSVMILQGTLDASVTSPVPTGEQVVPGTHVHSPTLAVQGWIC